MCVLVAACALPASVAGALTTTAPDIPHNVAVVISDKTIAIARDRFTQGSVTQYPRGAIIEFLITNTGSQAHAVRLVLKSKHVFTQYEKHITVITAGLPIPPGDRRSLPINFYYRGVFVLQVMSGTQVRASAPIVIF
jgi:hypothetical protein